MGADRPRILVVGNNSGAMHGSLVMNRFLVRALRDNGCEVSILDRAFSRRNTEIGKIRLHKLARAAGMGLEAGALGLSGRYDAAFYLPASLPPALTFDYFFLPLLRHLSRNWIGYSHMVRYRSLSLGPNRFQAMNAVRFWKSFDRCIGPSEAVAEDLRAVGVAPGRVRVLLNCLPPGWRYSDPAEVSRRALLEPSSIVFLSTVRARKGVWDILEAYHLLASRRPSMPRLVLIGPETEAGIFAAIGRWVSERGLDGSVDLRGELGHDEIEAGFESEPCVFVFPTRREEAFGLVLAEAMSKGVPVVASNIGAIPEVLDDGAAGILTPSEDPPALARALGGMLDDAGSREALALRGLEASRKYSFEAYSRSVGEVLRWAGIAPGGPSDRPGTADPPE
ncbi:MAG: glycosyltransferase family 4 protein [Candidatus Fermentibacter sp.]|nr:glycosyltransferase family 4 protein [Candidatus Fermentibacter sp.]